MEAIRNDTTKTLTASDILLMAAVKRPKGEANPDYGLDCPVCCDPIVEPQATDHTEEGLAHAACCVPLEDVKRHSDEETPGILKLADSIYESDLLKELRKDRERLDWIQANWYRFEFISAGEFSTGKLREEIDAEMRRSPDAEDRK